MPAKPALYNIKLASDDYHVLRKMLDHVATFPNKKILSVAHPRDVAETYLTIFTG